MTYHEAPRAVLLVCGALLIVAGYFWYRDTLRVAYVIAAIAAASGAAALVSRGFAQAFYSLWMSFAYILGYINSRILLSVVYYVIFVPYGIISRLVGRDPLVVRDRSRESYWHKRKPGGQARKRFERLF